MKSTYDVILFSDITYSTSPARALGAYRIATELRKHGYSTLVIDYFSQWLNEPKNLFNVLDKVIGSNTLFVGFSGVFFLDEFSNKYNNQLPVLATWPLGGHKMELYLKQITKKYSVKLVYGGLHTDAKVNNLRNSVDFIVKGLADTTVIELADHLSKKTPIKYMSTGGRAKLINHDTLARNFVFPSSVVEYQPEDYIVPGETLPMETSRGCLFKCSFCDYVLIGRKKGDPAYHKTTDTLAAEFKKNYEQFKVNQYMFVDDTFNETTDKLRDILEAKRISGVDIKFSCYLRVDLLARFPEQMEILNDLGIHTAFLGIESLYKPSAVSIGKSTDPARVKETIYELKKTCPGINIIGSFIIGLPEDNIDTLNTWVPWLLEEDNPIDNPVFYRLDLVNQPGSEISSNPEKFGYTVTESGWINKHWDSDQAYAYTVDLIKKTHTKQSYIDMSMENITQGIIQERWEKYRNSVLEGLNK